MQEITLVEYSPQWAAGVASMWNESSEGWNGETFNKTATSVLNEEKTSGALHVFLAVQGERVLGYCSLFQDEKDDDALYIAMLNVRPEHHGHKLGKRLVLRAVQAVRDYGRARLYLYTWPGNTKAVPLYKKTGFFWMDRDQGTHLVNFIPEVLRNELVAPYMEGMDWYADGTRELEVKPDGQKRDNFELYAYTWEKDGRKLRVEYNRHGRGLCGIENDDWSVRLEADQRKLAFGRSYPARLVVSNKSGQPLHVRIAGQNDGAITCCWRDQGDVTGERVFAGQFRIGPIERAQLEDFMHPCVTAEVEVNGRKATFRLGIRPQFPVSIGLNSTQQLHRPGQKVDGWLNMTNGSHDAIEVSLHLPSTECIALDSGDVKATLEGKGKHSVPCPFTFLAPGIYAPRPEVMVRYVETDEEVRFPLPLGTVLQGWQGSFIGKTEYQYVLAHGPYTFMMFREGSCNCMMMHDQRTERHGGAPYFCPPQIGPPYDKEFSQHETSEVHMHRDGDALVLRATFRSPRWPQAPLHIVNRMLPGGILERHLEVTNEGEEAVSLDVMDSMYLNGTKKVLPMPEGIVQNTADIDDDEGSWDYSRLVEPWVWVERGKSRSSMLWHTDEPVQKPSWDWYFEHHTGLLNKGETWRGKAVTYTLNAFRDWREFRTFAMGQDNQHTPVHTTCELLVDSPFVRPDMQAQARMHARADWKGHWQLRSQHGSIETCEAPLGKAGERVSMPVCLGSPRLMDRLTLTMHDNILRAQRSCAVFGMGGQMSTGEENRDGQRVLWADNGLLRMEGAPGFMPGVFSLQYNGTEWLENSFPKAAVKSWWNPWHGGILFKVPFLKMERVFDENLSGSVVRVRDKAGLEWTGLRFDVRVEKDEHSKGLHCSSYYLTLPGSPVLAMYMRIGQQAHHYWRYVPIYSEWFLRQDAVLHMPDGHGNTTHLNMGDRQHGENLNDLALVRAGEDTLLHVAPCDAHNHELFFSAGVVMGGCMQNCELTHGQEKALSPHWMLFGDNTYNINELAPLRHLEMDWDTEH